MFDMSTEQLIKVKPSKLVPLYKIGMIIADILALTTIPSLYTMGFLLFIVLVVITVLVFKYSKYEYEYSLTDGDMTIDRITSRSIRRRCGVFQIGKAELVTNPKTQDALRMEYKKLRKYKYVSNSSADNEIYIFTMDERNEQIQLIIEPNAEMLKAIKNTVNRIAYKVETEYEDNIIKEKE